MLWDHLKSREDTAQLLLSWLLSLHSSYPHDFCHFGIINNPAAAAHVRLFRCISETGVFIYVKTSIFDIFLYIKNKKTKAGKKARRAWFKVQWRRNYIRIYWALEEPKKLLQNKNVEKQKNTFIKINQIGYLYLLKLR